VDNQTNEQQNRNEATNENRFFAWCSTVSVVVMSYTVVRYPDKQKKSKNNMYLLHGKLTAKAGRRDELANILLDASKLVSTVKGCKVYVIGKTPDDLNSVYITEIWDSKEDHDNSLKNEAVRELIMKALPVIEGQPQKGQELEIIGGTGI
jgi:quinol monooxygenase YgiN